MSDTVEAGCDTVGLRTAATTVVLRSAATTVTTCVVDLDLTPPVAAYLFYADDAAMAYADDTAMEYA